MNETRLNVLMKRLSNPEQCLFAADCINHVIPTFVEIHSQHESVLQKSISVSTRYARGELDRPNLMTVRHYMSKLHLELIRERDPIAREMLSQWHKDPRQRKGPAMTRDESESIPRTKTWLDRHNENMGTAAWAAAWCHAAPETRLHYAQLTEALNVASAVLNLTGYEQNNPVKMLTAVNRAAEHKAETAAMATLPATPDRFIHYYGIGRHYGVGEPDREAVIMRQKMREARAQATAVAQEWQRKKLAEYL